MKLSQISVTAKTPTDHRRDEMRIINPEFGDGRPAQPIASALWPLDRALAFPFGHGFSKDSIFKELRITPHSENVLRLLIYNTAVWKDGKKKEIQGAVIDARDTTLMPSLRDWGSSDGSVL